MGNLFESTDIVKEVRSLGGGCNIALELIKFIVVIYVADAITGKILAKAIESGVFSFMDEYSKSLVCIGLLSFVALAYCAIWERMRPCHLGVAFRPVGKGAICLVGGYVAGAIIMTLIVLLTVIVGVGSISGNDQGSPLVILSFVPIFCSRPSARKSSTAVRS